MKTVTIFGRIPVTFKPIAVSLSIGFLYGIGYVVANVHFANLEVVRFDLIRGRYAGAGLLFLAFTVVPAALGLTVVTKVKAHDRAKANHQARDAVRELVTPVGLLWFSIALMSEFVLLFYVAAGSDPSTAGWKEYLVAHSGDYTTLVKYYSLAALLAAGLAFVSNQSGYLAPAGSSNPRGSSGIWQVCLVLFPLVLAVDFGLEVFPHISPAFGGGGIWLARVSINGSGGAVDSIPVALIDQDERVVNLVACPPRTASTNASKSRLLSVAIPAARVSETAIFGIESLPRFRENALRHGCDYFLSP